MKRIFLLAIIILAFTAVSVARQRSTGFTVPSVTLEAGESEEALLRKAIRVRPSAAQLRWQRLELTGFIHFGVNTFTDREWGDGKESPSVFNPTALDARQWARICRDAGIRQLILTAKHHDGFCLWPSKYTEHSVRNSPWKNGQGDVVRELAEACREYGLGFGVYLSPWDRNSPYFGDSAAYNDYFINQLTELLTQYGQIDEVWFDGANGEGPEGKKQVYDFNRWYAHIRKLQPQAVIAVMGPDVRWVGTESGYGRETEWSVVPADAMLQENIAANSQQATGFAPMNLMEDDLGSREKIRQARRLVWYPAEVDVSIRPGWFYHATEDSLVKTAEKLLDIYNSSVGRNGVLLLNIPPDRRGLIHEVDEAHLKAWRELREQVYGNNILTKGSSSLRGKMARKLIDETLDSYWSGAGGSLPVELEWSWSEPQRMDLLLLQENIREGQRIESFELQAWINQQWVTAAKGTTVGHKRIISFEPVTSQRVRLRITSSRGRPQLAAFGLYLQPPM